MGNERLINPTFAIVANAFLRREVFRLEDIGKTLVDKAHGQPLEGSALDGNGDGTVGFRWPERGVTCERVLWYGGDVYEQIWDGNNRQFSKLTPRPFDPVREAEWIARDTMPPRDMAIDPRRTAAFISAVFGFGALYDRNPKEPKFPTQLKKVFQPSSAREDRRLLDEAMALFSPRVPKENAPVEITGEYRRSINLLLGTELVADTDVETAYFVDRYPSASEQSLSYFGTEGDGVVGVTKLDDKQRIIERALWPDGTYREQVCNLALDTCRLVTEQKKAVPASALVMLSAALFGFQSLTDGQWETLKAFKEPELKRLDAALGAFGEIPDAACLPAP